MIDLGELTLCIILFAVFFHLPVLVSFYISPASSQSMPTSFVSTGVHTRVSWRHQHRHVDVLHSLRISRVIIDRCSHHFAVLDPTDALLSRELAVAWLGRLVAGLSPRRPGFVPWSVHVGFVADKEALTWTGFSLSS
jgi:hypothetical protein